MTTAWLASKPSNPKDIVGSDKMPLHLWPTTASAMGCLAFLEGALKYGRSNFRAVGVRATIYYDAVMRHLMAWFEGEDNDPDSGLPHMSHALACIAIIVDSEACGKLNDDRMIAGGYRKLMTKLTPHVKRIKELHKDKNPKHYTIADSVVTDSVLGCFGPGGSREVAPLAGFLDNRKLKTIKLPAKKGM